MYNYMQLLNTLEVLKGIIIKVKQIGWFHILVNFNATVDATPDSQKPVRHLEGCLTINTGDNLAFNVSLQI